MTSQSELRNFYNHYGHNETIQAIIDLLETLACHHTDNGDNDLREPFDNAIEDLENCYNLKPYVEN